MSLPDHFSYHFHPVGQGLFASGSIYEQGESSRFLWIYDCGTTSSQGLLSLGMTDLERRVGYKPKIDLLVLSHFDYDHISGVSQLIERFQIGTLMLPYMPMAQRMLIAFENSSDAPEESTTLFYINPVSYLLSLDGPGIQRILFVPPSGSEGPPILEEQLKQPDGGPDLKFDFWKTDAREEIAILTQGTQGVDGGATIDFLSPGSAIIMRSHWEFVPYNDDPEVPIDTNFVIAVESESASLISSTDSIQRERALRRLKLHYDNHFGKGSKNRNVISIFLYSGPIYTSWKSVMLCQSSSTHRYFNTRNHLHNYFLETSMDYTVSRSSIIYCGDGYLDTPKRLQRLMRFFRHERIVSTGVFQVMHHGSKKNWHEGVAAAISPLFSIFSSDPERKKWWHPHAPVLRDFWRFGAVQVDKEKGFYIWGMLDLPASAYDFSRNCFSSVARCPRCEVESLRLEKTFIEKDTVFTMLCPKCDWQESNM